MIHQPSIPVEIHGILRTTEDAVLVEFETGKVKWIPRDHAEFYPGHVLLTRWLVSRLTLEAVL